MKANEVSPNSFLSQTKTQYIIQVFQRNYDWTEEQCRQLFDDILEVNLPQSLLLKSVDRLIRTLRSRQRRASRDSDDEHNIKLFQYK